MRTFLDDLLDVMPMTYEGMLYRAKAYQDDNAYNVELGLPGFSKEDIKIETSGDSVIISAEIKEETYWKKSFKRFFRMPELIDEEDVIAKLEDGILKITLLKTKSKVKKGIEIS